MPRFFMTCLLALALCCNGVGATMAMPQEANPSPAAEAAGVMPCHDPAPASSSESPAREKAGDPRNASCCPHGQCFCGSIASAVLDLPMIRPVVELHDRFAPAIGSARVPPLSGAVLQRPPIG